MEKTYLLKVSDKEHINSKASFMINEPIIIKYDDYNNVVQEFRNNFKLAITAYLKVNLQVNYEGTVENTNKKIKGNDIITLKIPLSKTAISIDKELNDGIEKSIELDVVENKNITYLCIGYVIGALDIALLFTIFDKLFKTNRTPYKKQLEKITKDYSEIVVKLSEDINYEDKEIIKIDEFDDMLDIEQEFNSPIMYYETIKNRETKFIIVNNQMAYIYILKA